jgi:hypothetical protein
MDKIMRMNTVTSTIENGFVYLPEKAPWLAQYIHELVTFPKGKHDDQADSTSQALNWLKTRLLEPGIVTYYREEAINNWRKGRVRWEQLLPGRRSTSSTTPLRDREQAESGKTNWGWVARPNSRSVSESGFMIWVTHSRAMFARGWGETNARLLLALCVSWLFARATNELEAERPKTQSERNVLNILLSHPRESRARMGHPQLGILSGNPWSF